MEKADKVLIIPDVHGRTFWKDAVKGREDWHIIFLGDYHDPYPYESITQQESLENFKEIIELKKLHDKNVTLLIGNHDCTYCFEWGRYICDCRTDEFRHTDISKIFETNRKLFQMAIELNVGDKEYVFSHAPILKKWAEGFKYDKIATPIEYFNDAFQVKDENFEQSLCCCSPFRMSYLNDGVGSMVWADVRELVLMQEELFLDDYAIFGHTQLNNAPIVKKKYACLDCRKAFVLNKNGEITGLDGTIIPKI